MIYGVDGKAVAECIVRNFSVSGAQIELGNDFEMPDTFVLSLSRDGSVRRRCKKVWQFASVVGLSFKD
jgi:hypothetical protein